MSHKKNQKPTKNASNSDNKSGQENTNIDI